MPLGQKVNLHKSSIFFSTNVIHSNRVHLCHLLQMMEANTSITYLGLPNMMGQSKSVTLGFLKEKVRKRVLNWDGRSITEAGKEVLVKLVVQTLPTYVMNVFLVPINIIKEFKRVILKYWWGRGEFEL